MRSTFILRTLAALLLAGCASAGQGSGTYYVRFRADAPTSRHVVPYPAETVWRALPHAYAALQMPGGPAARELMEFTTPQLRVQGQLYGRHNSDFIDCGIVDGGGRALEDKGEVMLAMITRLQAVDGGTLVMTQVDSYARRREMPGNHLYCTSRGVLEEAVVAALLNHLRQAATAAP